VDLVNLCKEFGIGIGVLLSIAGMFFFLLKWVLEQFKVELTENRKERVEYLRTLAEMKDGITEHNSRSKEFMNNVGQEHREMIATLGRINGYKEH